MGDIEGGEVCPLVSKPRDKDEEVALCGDMYWVGEMKGNVTILCRSRATDRPVLAIGPHWPFVLLSYLGILGGSGGIYYFLWTRGIKMQFLVFGLCLTAVVLVSLSLLAIVDAGIVYGLTKEDVNYSFCERCKTFRAPKTIHCSECNVCIGGYDHHCPWTGKCVGEGNLLYFQIFLTSLILLIVYALILTVVVCLQTY